MFDKKLFYVWARQIYWETIPFKEIIDEFKHIL